MAGQEVVLKESGEVMSQADWYKDPLVDMSVAQEQVALLLEVAYLALKDHPVVAKEVRLSANMSRTQHMMTLGLMKLYVVTSSNILKTMIPLIRTAVKLKKSTILKPMFLKVLKFSEEMRDEAVKTRTSYFQLQDKIQKDAADVNIENTRVNEKQKEIAAKSLTETERKKRAEEHFSEQEKKRKQLDEDIKQSKAKRDEMLQKAVPDGDKEPFRNLMKGLSPKSIIEPSTVLSVIKSGVAVVGMVAQMFKEKKEGERLIAISQEHQKHMLDATTEKERADKEFVNAEKERADAAHQLRMLELEKSSLGDLESLVEASTYLGQIDSELVSIITFWDNLAAFLKNLTQQGEMGECFLEAIEDDECAALFNEELLKVENGWKHFGAICSRYVQNEEASIPQIYGFLSEPIDSLSKEARQERSKKLIAKIKARVPLKAVKAAD